MPHLCHCTTLLFSTDPTVCESASEGSSGNGSLPSPSHEGQANAKNYDVRRVLPPEPVVEGWSFGYRFGRSLLEARHEGGHAPILLKILLEFELLLSFSARNSMLKQVSQAIVGVRSTSWQGLAQRLGVNDKPPSGPVQGRRMNIPTIVERARFLSSVVLYCHQVPLGLMKAPGLLCCGNKVWRSEETGDHDIRHARCLAEILAILPGHAGLQRPPVSLSCKRPSQDQDTEIR